MTESLQNLDAVDSGEIQRLALERVRFERLMGVEFVPRVAFAKALEAATPEAARPSLARTLTPQPPAPAQRTSASAAREIAAAQLAAAKLPQKIATPTAVRLSEPELAERWRMLEEKARACSTCPLIAQRSSVVFGTGSRTARLMFIGQGPGEEEASRGEPFLGKSGKLLDDIIGAMKLTRAEVYLCNAVGCRTPANRPPLPDELAACAPHLLEQIELVAPKVIVALGGIAANALLHSDLKIDALRGRWREFRGIPVMPTFHPAFVLSRYIPEVRGQVWSDMQQVMVKLA